MKRVALYCRVSTDKQVKGDSIPAQLAALREYARKESYEIVGEYIDDGVSGTLLEQRDELQNMLSEVKKGNIDLILFTKLDRWFRSVRHYLNTQNILEEHNVCWRAIWENYETETAVGRLMITQMISFAEFEAANTAARINRVFDYKKEQREVVTGKVPRGYSIVDKHLVPNDDAQIIKMVFDTYIETGSVAATMRRTEGFGLPKSNTSFKRLLMNRKYIGEAYGHDDYCTPIIDRKTFETVQRMLKMNIKASQVHEYIFSGLIWCSECGGKMIGTSNSHNHRKKIIYSYRCQRHAKTLKECDNSFHLNEEKLEKFLVQNLSEFAIAEINETGETKKESYDKQVAAIERKITKLKELYVNELIGLEEYKRDLNTYKSDLNELKQKINELQIGGKDALKELVGKNLSEWYWDLNNSEKRLLWRSVIERIDVDAEKNINVSFL